MSIKEVLNSFFSKNKNQEHSKNNLVFFAQSFTDKEHNTKRIPYKANTIFGVYLHGELDSYNKYDLVSSYNEMPKEKGIYPCVVILSDGTYVNAELYFWIDSFNLIKGLIVDPRNKKDAKDAKFNYDIEKHFL